MIRPDCRALSAVLALTAVLTTRASWADIPADYTGTPYLGKPSAIPGRVELTNVDLGGEGVAYHADHRRSNSAGYEPISGNDYRPDDKDLPNICKTNEANRDVWADDGTTYPSEADKSWYYIGYAHAVDWVKITVDVKAAGKYYVSSYWASAGDKWGLSIWFNDGKGTVDPARPKDGVNKTGIIEMDGTADYHKWKKYPNFATVDLSAGLQVMTFHLEKHDHLQYGFLQFDPVDGMTGLGGAGAGGAAGTGGGGGSAAGGSPSGGVAGTETSGGTAGAPTQVGGGAGGTAPTSSAGTTSSSGTTPQTPTGNSPQANDSSGCSFGRGGTGRIAAGLGLLGAFLALRRRSRRAS